MTTFVVFIVALILIISLLTVKNIELSTGRTFFHTRLFTKSDSWLLNLWFKIFDLVKKITWSNIYLIFQRIFVNIRQLMIFIKRRFDHKQSHFFTKRDHHNTKNKGAVSFFLKDVAEYKKQLRHEGKDL